MGIYGESTGDKFGSAVSISGNGMIVAVGTPFNNRTGSIDKGMYEYSLMMVVNGFKWEITLKGKGHMMNLGTLSRYRPME